MHDRVFTIVATSEPAPKLEAAINASVPGNKSLKIAPVSWPVSSDGTSKSISGMLDLTPTKEGTKPVVVVATAGYYGRASTYIWEWIKAELEGRSD